MSNSRAQCPRCIEERGGHFSASVSFRRGRYSGPPEDCYPDESDIDEVEDCDECGVEYDALTQVEQDKVDAQLWANVEEPDPPEWEPED